MLFSDLVGSTTLGEMLDPEEVDELVSAAQHALTEVVQHYGGHVAKYLGDGMMALFGAPIAREDDAERAVLAGMKMIAALEDVNAKQRQDLPPLQMRIGITTGEVIGGDTMRGYDVTGDAANTAARLQSAADVGGVLVSEDTMHLARRRIQFGTERELNLKGKAELVKAYPAVAPHDRLMERWEMHGGQAPLIGREEELAVLNSAWSDTLAARGGMVTITAEPGTGKSRLLAEIVDRIMATESARILRGRCLSYSEHLNLWLVADLVRSAFNIQEQDRADRIEQQVSAHVALRLESEDEETRTIAVDVLGEVLGLPRRLSPISGAEPQIRRQALITTLGLLLRSTCALGPLLLILEDTHWVDAASQEVVGQMLNGIPDLPMLVFSTRRNEGHNPWAELPWVRHMTLRPLNEQSALRLAAHVLGGRTLAPALERDVLERSGGNPFFLEELLRGLQEAGELEERDDVVHLVEGAAARIPSTLTEILLARLDRLKRDTRSVAQVGSDIGRSFLDRLLCLVADRDPNSLQPVLGELQGAELVLASPKVAGEYAFRHATVREVAYNTLLNRRRQVLHAAVARSMLQLYPSEEFVDIIAHHYGRSAEHAEAAIWLERSADRAAAIYANSAAIEQYREVQKRQELINSGPGDRARIDEKLGHILRTIARFDEALEVLDRAAIAYRDVADLEGERRVTAEMGRVHRARGTPEEGIARIQRLLDADTVGEPTSGVAALNVVLARLYFNVGKYAEEVEAAARGAEIAQRLGDRRVLAEAEMSRSLGLLTQGMQEEGLQVMLRAIPVAEEVADFDILYALLGNTAVIYRETGDFERSREYRERSVQVTARMGDPANHSFARASVAQLHFYLGNWDRAEEELHEALDLVRSLQSAWHATYSYLYMGHLHGARGEFDAAEEALCTAQRIANEGGDHQGSLWSAICLGEMDLLRGESNRALHRFDDTVDLSDLDEADVMLTTALPVVAWALLECGRVDQAAEVADIAMIRAVAEHSILDLLDAQRVVGMVASRQQRWDDADSHFREVLALAREVRYAYAEARTLHEWGRTLLAQGSHHEGFIRLAAAEEIFAHLGAQPYLDKTRELLENVAATSM